MKSQLTVRVADVNSVAVSVGVQVSNHSRADNTEQLANSTITNILLNTLIRNRFSSARSPFWYSRYY